MQAFRWPRRRSSPHAYVDCVDLQAFFARTLRSTRSPPTSPTSTSTASSTNSGTRTSAPSSSPSFPGDAAPDAELEPARCRRRRPLHRFVHARTAGRTGQQLTTATAGGGGGTSSVSPHSVAIPGVRPGFDWLDSRERRCSAASRVNPRLRVSHGIRQRSAPPVRSRSRMAGPRITSGLDRSDEPHPWGSATRNALQSTSLPTWQTEQSMDDVAPTSAQSYDAIIIGAGVIGGAVAYRTRSPRSPHTEPRQGSWSGIREHECIERRHPIQLLDGDRCRRRVGRHALLEALVRLPRAHRRERRRATRSSVAWRC